MRASPPEWVPAWESRAVASMTMPWLGPRARASPRASEARPKESMLDMIQQSMLVTIQEK